MELKKENKIRYIELAINHFEVCKSRYKDNKHIAPHEHNSLDILRTIIGKDFPITPNNTILEKMIPEITKMRKRAKKKGQIGIDEAITPKGEFNKELAIMKDMLKRIKNN